MPPDRHEPIGTSARNIRRTESISSRRYSCAASSKVPSNRAGASTYHGSVRMRPDASAPTSRIDSEAVWPGGR